MRKAAVAAAALLLTIAAASDASAWGFEAHKFIMRRALDLLPADLKAFYERNRDEVVMRSTDPDLWRNVGWDEDQNHFIDFGVKEYGEPPFTALPRELGAAIKKFGAADIKRNGMLPWRADELSGDLRRTFESFARGSTYAFSDLALFTGALSHYVQDAHQPLHATVNYDGELSGNAGIHSRFERDLFERFQARLQIHPAPPVPIVNVRDAAFDALVAGYGLAAAIFRADTEAVAGKDVYDDDYYDKLFARTEPVLRRCLSDAITSTAGVIIGAWQQAGRPSVPAHAARPPAKVKRPQP
jgi:hypothetical protein